MLSSNSKRIIKQEDEKQNDNLKVKNYALGEVNSSVSSAMRQQLINKWADQRSGEPYNFTGGHKRALEEELETLRKKAYNDGFKSGQRNGFEEGLRKSSLIMEELKLKMISIIQSLSETASDMEQHLEKELLVLSVRIAAQVVKQEIEINDQVIMSIIKEALKGSYTKGEILIRLNPEDIEFVNRFKNEIIQEINDIRDIELVSDQTVSKGGCFVESRYGDIDARLESQFRLLAEEIKNWVKY